MPISLPIFHFTHIDNISSIIQDNLKADNCIDSEAYINSGNLEIKKRRREILLPCGKCVAHYVPFYYAPRSPMLFTQYKNENIEQSNIVYLVYDAHILIEKEYDWYYSTHNAAHSLAEFGTTVDGLSSEIDHSLMQEEYWYNTDSDPSRQARRMAEFLVYQEVLFDDIYCFVVYDERARERLQYVLGELEVPIHVRRNFYY